MSIAAQTLNPSVHSKIVFLVWAAVSNKSRGPCSALPSTDNNCTKDSTKETSIFQEQ